MPVRRRRGHLPRTLTSPPSATADRSPPVRHPTRAAAADRHALVLRLLRMAARHRRLLAALLVGLSVAMGLSALRPPLGPLSPLVVAAADLPAGHRLTGSDLGLAQWPADLVPAGGATDAASLLGQVLADGLHRGEPVLDTRLIGPGLALGLDPRCRVLAVPLSQPPPPGLLRPGDRVDLVTAAAGATPGEPGTLLAEAALLLAGPSGQPATQGGLLAGADSGSQIVVAVDARDALGVAAASGVAPVSVALRPPDSADHELGCSSGGA